jgi:AcrR family transcriptional regulator
MDNPRRAARRAEVERNDRALLDAARAVLAEDGVHVSVAAVAARAGVGIGTLYRRYPTKERLLQRLSVMALTSYLRGAEEGLARDDPWEGLAHFVTHAVLAETGALGPVAGTIEVTDEMTRLGERGDEVAGQVIERAHAAGVLRPEATDVDIALLIEQLGRAPVVDQLARQGHDDLLPAARAARARLIRIALDGLRAPAPDPLPGAAPTWDLFTRRWSTPADQGAS